MESSLVIFRDDRSPSLVRDATKLEIVGVRQGGETDAEIRSVRSSEWVDSCQASKEQVLCSGIRTGAVPVMAGWLTSFNKTTSPTAYSGFRPPAAFVTDEMVTRGP